MGIDIVGLDMNPKKENNRKLITFFLISYNQEQFIREALEGAFSQTYQPLEIVLSDDCSTDRTFEIMRQLVLEYKGPHKIVLNQNEQNLGLCGNVNRILDLAAGEIIVIAAGDDISLPDRVEKSWKILEENPDSTCVSFQLQIIEGNGTPRSTGPTTAEPLKKYSLTDFVAPNWLHINGASRAFKKSVYEYFGPLSDKAVTEDSTTLLRCLMLGNVCYSGEMGVRYRIHGGNYYSSNNKHRINYKRIYWQYITDVKRAVRKDLITPLFAKKIKTILRTRLNRNMLNSGFYLAESRAKYFFSKILFSNIFNFRSKKHYFIKTIRIFRKRVNGV